MLEILEEALTPGTRVTGGYRLERVLGEGGMGVVWAAREEATGRTVALKFLREGRAEDPIAHERFAREARAVMEVVHPNVVRVEAVLETDSGAPFLVMEHLEGESMRKLLSRRGTLHAAECASLVLPVVDAVVAAHSRGLVHRDLKPENIFLTASGDVRVLDFGIAKRMARPEDPGSVSLTSTGALVGTPFYMAPEQIFGDDDIDGRVDVWALGIVLYECVAGKRPTDGTGFGQVLKRITTERLEAVQIARPGLPRDFATLVGRMLARPRDERPTLAEVRLILERVARGPDAMTVSERTPMVGSSVPPPTTTDGVAHTAAETPAPISDPGTRSRRLLVLVAALGLGLVGMGAVTWRARSGLTANAAATEGENQRNAANIALRATQALAGRDGAACVRDMDEHDRLDPRPEVSSTAATSAWAPARGNCLMLVGRCKEGKDLMRRWLVATSTDTRTEDSVELQVEMTAAYYCEGGGMTPRDRLLAANVRLIEASGGLRPATAKQCVEWFETERTLTPLVPPRSPSDVTIVNMPLGRTDRITGCLARANACDLALTTYKSERARLRPEGSNPQAYDEESQIYYRMLTALTPCKGKP